MLSRPNDMLSEQPGAAFDLSDNCSYESWREQKLRAYPTSIEQLTVNIDDLAAPRAEEVAAIEQRCRVANMAILRSGADVVQDRQIVANLGKSLGLISLDQNIRADDGGISALCVSPAKQAHEYIPYSNRAINWHTDGYYNTPDKKIRAMVLHCASVALRGGANQFVDHEILYLLLRDENVAYIKALMQMDVMTIPANIENGVDIRALQSGPVFSVDSQSGHLHMRYTARTRSIEWKPDSVVLEAVEFIRDFLQSDSPYIFSHRLQAGEVFICNNVLHNRSEFTDGDDVVDNSVNKQPQKRLVYRGRFYERIN